ncbi:MAG: hypothetical protein ACRDRA_01440 [Pseudonocardiaceae bacterium]
MARLQRPGGRVLTGYSGRGLGIAGRRLRRRAGVSARTVETLAGRQAQLTVRAVAPPKNLLIVILDLVPGCDRSAGFSELAVPHRSLEPGGQVWSNLMDPVVTSQLIGGVG